MELADIERTHCVKFTLGEMDFDMKTNIGVYADGFGCGKTRVMANLIRMRDRELQTGRPVPGVNRPRQAQMYIPTRQGDSEVSITSRTRSCTDHPLSISNGCTLIISPKRAWTVWYRELYDLGIHVDTIKTQSDAQRWIRQMDIHSSPRVILCRETMYKTLYNEHTVWERVILDDTLNLSIPHLRTCLPQFSMLWCVTPLTGPVPRTSIVMHLLEPYTLLLNSVNSTLASQLCISTGTRSDHEYTLCQMLQAVSVRNATSIETSGLHGPEYITHHCVNSASSELIALQTSMSEKLVRAGGTLLTVPEIFKHGPKDQCHKYRMLLLENWFLNKNDGMENAQQIHGQFDSTSITDNICPVCMCEIPSLYLDCAHGVCLQCANCMLSNESIKCPLCRAVSPLGRLCIVQEEDSMQHCVPFRHDTTRHLLRDPEKQILIYVDGSSDVMMKQLSIAFNGDNIPHVTRFDYTEQYIDMFQKGYFSMLVVRSKKLLVGLDLPHVTDLIMFCDENVQKEITDQVVSSCQRLGRTSPLQVHTFIDV